MGWGERRKWKHHSQGSSEVGLPIGHAGRGRHLLPWPNLGASWALLGLFISHDAPCSLPPSPQLVCLPYSHHFPSVLPMEPRKRPTGDEPGEERLFRCRLQERGATSHADHGRPLVLDAPSVASPALSSRAPAAGHARELEQLRGYLEVTQAVLWAAELEVETVRA